MQPHENRTIVISTPYFPPQTGGVERYVFELAKHLQRQFSYNVVVITSGEKSSVDKKEIYEGIIVHRLGYSVKISNTPFSFRWFFRVRRLLKEIKPDIVNVHMPVPGLGDIVALFTSHKKLVLTYHGQSMRKGTFFSDLAIVVYEDLFLLPLLRRASRIVCSSEFVRHNFLRRYVHKSVTIPPAVDTSLFHEGDRSKKGTMSLLFVASELSRACEYKGLPLLLKAFREVHRRGIPATLTVVGDGDLREAYVSEVQKYGLASQVQFTGRLHGEDLRNAYAAASIFVLPTSNDSYPTVILEAMAAGLPVISTTVGDIPKMVSDGTTGFLVKPHDEQALVEKLCRLLANYEEATALGRAGRERIVTGYSWDARAGEYDKLFQILGAARAIVHCVGYFPPHLGGMEQRVEELTTLLAERGRKVIVLTSNIGTRTGRELRRGVEVVYQRTFEFAHTPIVPGLLFRLLFLPKGSVLHLHVAQAFFPEIVWLAAKIRGFPYIAHIRLLIEIPSGFLGRFLPLYSKYVLGPVLRGAEKIIVLTPGYREILTTKFNIPEDRIVVIPNATTFARTPQPRTGARTPLRLLAVGRISVQKNYPLMLKAVALLKHEFKLPFTLTIVGSSIHTHSLDTQARDLGIEEEVRFAGQVVGEHLQKLYEDSDLFIHTALAEGFGTVIIEAMAKGLPLVATNVLGVNDMITPDKNGVLCALEPRALAEGVMCFIEDSVFYARVSANNLKEVEHYKWETIIDHTDHLYDSL